MDQILDFTDFRWSHFGYFRSIYRMGMTFEIKVAPRRKLCEPAAFARFIMELTDKQVARHNAFDADDRDEFQIACDAFNLSRIKLRFCQDNAVGSIDHPFLDRIVEHICTKRQYDSDDFASAVEATQHRVRHPFGLQPLECAFELAQRRPVKLIDEKVSRSRACSQIAAIALHLQESEGERPIFLPIEQVRRLLRLRKLVVSGAVRRLLNCGVLESVNEAYNRGKAREFRFVGRRGQHYEFADSEEGVGTRPG
jgi:hypothetical protein